MAPIKRSDVEMDTDDGRVYVVASEAYQQHPSWRTRRNGSTFWRKKNGAQIDFFPSSPQKIVENSFVETKNGHAECSVT